MAVNGHAENVSREIGGCLSPLTCPARQVPRLNSSVVFRPDLQRKREPREAPCPPLTQQPTANRRSREDLLASMLPVYEKLLQVRVRVGLP